MKICTFKESADWCERNGFPTRQIYPVAGPDPFLSEPEFHFARFAIPEDAGRRVWLAKLLLSIINPTAELLMQIGDWSVWPSGQHMPLFERFRQSFGDHRPLIEAPAHVLGAAEKDDSASILIISVLFLWNCHVLAEGGKEAFFVSHDEYGWFAARETARLNQIRTALTESGVVLANAS